MTRVSRCENAFVNREFAIKDSRFVKQELRSFLSEGMFVVTKPGQGHDKFVSGGDLEDGLCGHPELPSPRQEALELAIQSGRRSAIHAVEPV
jgi:hypothetical protein